AGRRFRPARDAAGRSRREYCKRTPRSGAGAGADGRPDRAGARVAAASSTTGVFAALLGGNGCGGGGRRHGMLAGQRQDALLARDARHCRVPEAKRFRTMSTSEDELAGRIVRRLDRGLDDIDPHTLALLRSARTEALERMRSEPVSLLAWAD